MNKNSSEIIKQIKEEDSEFWSGIQEKKSLELFHQAYLSVPAYSSFLNKRKVNAEKVLSWDDFKKVPLTSKKDYLRNYSLEKLSWEGNLKKPLVFTSTSGSTGEPFYFMRANELDWQYSVLIEEYLKNNIAKNDSPTLVVIGFGMGIWIGGLITYKAFEIASIRLNYPLSIITPGINKKEIFNILKNLSPHFKNVILVGYPPFIKDIIDEAPLSGVNLNKFNLRLLFAAEAFTESFRDYLAEKSKIKNVYLDTMNIYGTADIGAMAYETPLSILIRRICIKNTLLFQDIFGSINKTPTLAQFNPMFVNFEAVNGNIVLTGNNSIPLIRYSVGDHGGVYTYKEINEILRKHNIDILKEAKNAGILESLNQLPFVFVFERNDFSVTLYGLQIYPEIIRETVLEEPFSEFLTGKFTLVTKFSKKQNQYLEINIEMKKNIDGIPHLIEKKLLKQIVINLRHKNSEFRELSNYLKNRANPKLVFWKSEDPEHFKVGTKQKWAKK